MLIVGIYNIHITYIHTMQGLLDEVRKLREVEGLVQNGGSSSSSSSSTSSSSSSSSANKSEKKVSKGISEMLSSIVPSPKDKDKAGGPMQKGLLVGQDAIHRQVPLSFHTCLIAHRSLKLYKPSIELRELIFGRIDAMNLGI